jgi:uncharacterized coiled-coil DUF342 family protein
MGKNTIDRLRKEIERLEEQIRAHPCDCAETNALRKELEEHRKALERQEQQLVKALWI